jgi:peptide chain release factor 1
MAWPDDVTKKDLRIDWFSGTGGGGQYRNKHMNSCRITHLPTGMVGQSQDERSRVQNQKVAFRRLVEQLVPLMKREVQRERYAAGTERVRNYHQPDDRVTDARVPDRQWPYDAVLDGNALAEIIQEVRQAKARELLGD